MLSSSQTSLFYWTYSVFFSTCLPLCGIGGVLFFACKFFHSLYKIYIWHAEVNLLHPDCCSYQALAVHGSFKIWWPFLCIVCGQWFRVCAPSLFHL